MGGTQVTKVRSSSPVLVTCFKKFLKNKFLRMIPRKFSRNSPELVPNFRDFLGIIVLRLVFKKFLRISLDLVGFFEELHKRHSLAEFLRISKEFFSGYSPEKFPGIGYEKWLS